MSHLNEYRGHALVTNTSLGIGAAIASRLLYDDRHVTGLDRALSGAPYFASLTHDLLDADAVRSALVATKVDAFVHAAGFMRVGELGSLDLAAGTDIWGVTVATRQRLPRGGRIRADCDGNADAGRFGQGQRATPSPPIGRFVRPEEIAATTAFLLSEEAAAITGQQPVTCGGSSL
jgi:NAD(P)-dependent dehydrogenase (short-subunit alcohol dehydrogenase family)